MWQQISKIAVSAIAVAPVAAGTWLLRYRSRVRTAELRRQRRLYEEMKIYSGLDLRSIDDGARLAATVCQAIAHASLFRRVAVLLRDDLGSLSVTSASGLEERTRCALEAWSTRLGDDGSRRGVRIRRGDPGLGCPLTRGSYVVKLGERPCGLGYEHAIVMPMWTLADRLEGAIVLCADTFESVPSAMIDDALAPIEGLALKIGRSLENAALAESLMRADRLAQVGVVAGGMAHALTNPLTAVVGFAELIMETSAEPRAREDAGVILREALRMRETVERVFEFGRSMVDVDETVSLMETIRLLVDECTGKLRKRGVELIVQVAGDPPWISADRARIREMLEHLLNHASHAVAGAELDGAGHAIRISVSRQADRAHLVISDTASRFSEPAAMFDSFGVAGEPLGLDLALCYRIVRRLGGQMRAFNLFPCGAAVAVELPATEPPEAAHSADMRHAAREILA